MCQPKVHNRLDSEAGLLFVVVDVEIGTMAPGVEEISLKNEIAFGSEATQTIATGTGIYGRIENVAMLRSLLVVTRTTDGFGRTKTAIQKETRLYVQIPETRQALTRQRLFRPLVPCPTN